MILDFKHNQAKLEFNLLIQTQKAKFAQMVLVLFSIIYCVYALNWWAQGVAPLFWVNFVSLTCFFILIFYEKLGFSINTVAVLACSIAMCSLYLIGLLMWPISPIPTSFIIFIPLCALFVWGLLRAMPIVIASIFCILTVPVFSAQVVAWFAMPTNLPYYHTEIRIVFILLGCLSIVMISRNLSLSLFQSVLDKSEELEQAQEQLIETQQVKNRFFASVSHEIRTPMNAIRGIAELMMGKDSNLGAVQDKELVSALHGASTHLLSIVNDLLDISKLEENKLKLIEACTDLREMIADTYNIVHYSASEKRLNFNIEIDAKLPDKLILDANRVRQCLVNLLSNAVKFTPQGAVHLDCLWIAAVPASGTGEKIRFVVSDTGVGIPIALQTTIFDGYVQGENTKFTTGTGLGLHVTQRIVKLMQGAIWLESVEGEGSRFYMEFPLRPAQVKAEHPSHVSVVDGHAGVYTNAESNPTEGGRLCIMIVDDNPLNCMVAQKLLELHLPFVKIQHATNGQEALDLLVQSPKLERPGLILMDVHMPVLNGLETTRQLRRHSDLALRNVPIIAITANTAEEDIKACFEAGMNDFVSKPFEIRELVGKIRQYISSQLSQAKPVQNL